MSKELLKISFDELHLNHNIEGTDFINIDKEGVIKKYKVINTVIELLRNTSNLTKDLGILVTCECKNISVVHCNTIFLKNVVIEYMISEQEVESSILIFKGCSFLGKVEMIGGKYQNILIENSIFKNEFSMMHVQSKSLNDINNIFEKPRVIEESIIHYVKVDAAIINENFSWKKVRTLEDCIMDGLIIKKELNFTNCRVDGVSKFNKLEIQHSGELSFSHCSFYKTAEINFDKILGKLRIYKTTFGDKCYLEYEQLQDKNYEPLIIKNDLKKTKWNFFYVADIYKSNGKTEQYLETFYYFKKYERLEKKRIVNAK
ncbi:two pore domain potassium channel family protein [Clostridium estertheticum]|uniref:two pore domain potassium channel family protein n=1 Tax=Clostridium estertheticum TaxID=238834 RepID=UPI001CF55D3C|nr:two pore domain potassium channel family protein [Clostridium estertheticum]MCB2354392.1 two pore domain potassium channel family protein [Clostridium estertheticum]WAG42491.1 two pore domain potassium channel family protein [Clostridium estertheticum]